MNPGPSEAIALSWAAIVVLTTLRRRHAAVAWLGLVIALSASFSLLGACSAKVKLFKLAVGLVDRYYFESAYLVPLFSGLACVGVDLPRIGDRRAQWGIGIAATTVGLVALLAVGQNSRSTATLLAAAEYRTHEEARRFTVNLTRDLDRLSPDARRDLTLAEGTLPSTLSPLGPLRHHSQFLALLHAPARFSPRASFRIAPNGRIVPR